jgi:hypothetical protein
MTSRSVRVRPTAIVVLVAAVLLIGISAAAAQISGSDLPGRERDRFVDPPGARLLQPRERNTVLPYGTSGPQIGCPPGKSHRKQRARKRCR